MQKKIMKNLSKLAVPIQSKGRFFKEIKTSLRNDFQRDRAVSYTHLRAHET